jgi:hypothetical protein
MTNSTTISARRRAHSIPASPPVRRHRSEVARWALAKGYLAHRDALAAIVGARAGSPGHGPVTSWTAADVAELLWSGAAEWCASNGAEQPADLAPTLATYLRYLSTHRLLDGRSDDVATLRRAIAENRRVDQSGRSRHPAGANRAPVLPIS